MAAPQNFRSAFNGFNREDVVHYIEYLNAKHSAELNQLNAELELLRTKPDTAGDLSAIQEQLIAAESERDELQQQLTDQQSAMEELQSQLEDALTKPADSSPNQELEARCASLERQLQSAIAAQVKAETERDTAKAQAASRNMEQELEAYRRAERTERIAKERAELVYRQANGALADATVKVDEAFAQIGDLSDQVSAQLAQLQTAVRSSKQALSDAANTLYTIRPGSTED